MSAPADTKDLLARAVLALEAAQARERELTAEIARLRQESHPSVAIVGMAARFPGADEGLARFAAFLAEGGDASRDAPPDRGLVAYPPDGRIPRGSFLLDPFRFDAARFGISPREARAMDPQHRLLLDVASDALLDAGPGGEALAERTGVFVGISSHDYANVFVAGVPLDELTHYAATGNAHAAASGRLAYHFGFNGPTLSVDTACSSSLAALHLAVQSLRRRECDRALVGGVNVLAHPVAHWVFDRSGMLARDGRSKAFSAHADGYGRGEGVGVLVLQRADDLPEGRTVYALVRGTAIGQDGRSAGLTVPNGPAQVAVLRAACADANLDPSEVTYVEAHGTGTPLGDPLEMQALGEVYGPRRSGRLLVGSVKTNIGHCEAAAGVAAVIKTALMLRLAQIYPSLHADERNPHIPWDRWPIEVASALEPWLATQRRAGVSSFGFTGTNVHVILEGPETAPIPLDRCPGTRSAHAIPSFREFARSRDAAPSFARLVWQRHAPNTGTRRRWLALVSRSSTTRPTLETHTELVELLRSLDTMDPASVAVVDLRGLEDGLCDEPRQVVERLGQVVALARALETRPEVPWVLVTRFGARVDERDPLGPTGSAIVAAARALDWEASRPPPRRLDLDSPPEDLVPWLSTLLAGDETELAYRSSPDGPELWAPRLRVGPHEIFPSFPPLRAPTLPPPEIQESALLVGVDSPGAWDLIRALQSRGVRVAATTRHVGLAAGLSDLGVEAPSPSVAHIVALGQTSRAEATLARSRVPATLWDATEDGDLWASRGNASGDDVRRWPWTSEAAASRGRAGLIANVSGTWILSGATGSLGGHLANWLLARGARRVVALSRRGEVGNRRTRSASTPGVEDRTLATPTPHRPPPTNRRTEIIHRPVDVCNPEQVDRVVQEFAADICGVIHAAGVLLDQPLSAVSPASLWSCLEPKLLGAETLVRAAARLPLERFVVISSAVTLLGNAGQFAYQGANGSLDGFADAWRRRGCPVCVVGFGPWTIGMAAEHSERFFRRGVVPSSPTRALAALDAAWTLGATTVQQLEIRPERFLMGSPASRFESLVDPAASSASGVTRALQPSGSPRQWLEATVQRLLDLPPKPLDFALPLLDLGADSLVTTELRRALACEAQIRVEEKDLDVRTTLADLLKLWVDSPKNETERDRLIREIAGLSDDEVVRRLAALEDHEPDRT